MKTIEPPALRPHLTITLWHELLRLRRRRGIKKMRKILFTVLLFLVLGPWSVVPSPVFAQTPQVPHLLNFQSVLTDAAGVPLPDGMYDVTSSIVDAEGQELYAENQTLEAAQGVVSAMVGAQGSLDLSQFDPETPKFLHVGVAGQGPTRSMEIVTVPYSLYAQQALGAAPQSIGGEAIQPGAITAEHLAEDVLGDIRNNLFYSQGSDLPTVLRDLDVAIQQRQVNLDNAQVNLQDQIGVVTEGTTLQEQLDIVEGTVATHDHNGAGEGGSLPYSMRPFAFGEIGPGPACAVLSGYNIAATEFDGGDHCRVVFANATPNTNYIVLVTREGDDSHASNGTVYHDKTTTGVWVSTGDVSRKVSVLIFGNF
ncbi:MAG: hypothetical protein HY609_06385 [Deltaproteobacteria bacterium]|nr:hypothetical protein [Deltaproteobacteria bacterium]